MTFDKLENPEQLYTYMKNNIKYGFVSNKDFKTYARKELNNDTLYEALLFNTYYLQRPKECLKSGYGICYDQVELERYWFSSHNYEVFTYYTPYHNHVFLVYKDGANYYSFERTIEKYNGIDQATSLDDAITNYKRKQLKDTSMLDIDLYQYESLPFGCNIYELIDDITKEKKLGTKLKQRILKINSI